MTNNVDHPTTVPDVTEGSTGTAGSERLERELAKVAFMSVARQSWPRPDALRQWEREQEAHYAPILGLPDPQRPGSDPTGPG